MFEISFRFRHGCEVNRLSEEFPDVLMAQWCNYNVEVLEVHTRDERRFNDIRDSLAKLAGSKFEVYSSGATGQGTRMLLMRCCHRKGGGIDSVVDEAGCLYLAPCIYREGWEHYRVIAFDEPSVRRMFTALGKLGEVELLQKREHDGDLLGRAFMVSTADLLAGVTKKQATALAAAIEHGYYHVPRRVKTEDIARRHHVPRTTFEEHVRKAESKVIRALAPYVALHAGRAKPAAAEPPRRRRR